MLTLRKFLILAALGLSFACASTVAVAEAMSYEAPDKVLFVGNSFSFYNNGLHTHYRALVRASNAGDKAERRIRMLTISGARLPEHRAGLNAMLDADNWDVVVLQGHSRGPIEEATARAFRDAAREFVGRIREHGAEPVFFMTWAYVNAPEMTDALEAAYSGIARELDARVAPVGIAFANAARERPDIALHTDDDRHPSLAGTYLAACVFYSVLQGDSPEGIDYDAGLDPEVVQYLQQLAWETASADRYSGTG
jgi:hypothetical protein